MAGPPLIDRLLSDQELRLNIRNEATHTCVSARQAIKTSVQKTSRVLIAHEDCLSWGYGAELAARIASELFECLDAPVGRVGALDTWVGYHPQLENEILPQPGNIVKEAERLLEY